MTASAASLKVFIGSIPTEVSESELRAALIKYGNPTTFHYSPQPAHRGWALVSFETIAEASEAIAGLNGQLVFQTCITPLVSRFANEKSSDSQSSANSSAIGSRHSALVGLMNSQGGASRFSTGYSAGGAGYGAQYGAAPQTGYASMGGGPMGGMGMGAAGYGLGQTISPSPPLPPPSTCHWLTYYTQEGHPYYYNIVTKITQWEKPQDLLQPQIPSMQSVNRGMVMPMTSMNNTGLQSIPANVLGARKFGPPGCNLFVFHVPSEWENLTLYQHFQHYGNIISCRVKTDEAARNLGFGFISYDNPNSAFAAIRGMHGFNVGGKWLKVTLKKGEEHLLPPSLQALYNKGGKGSTVIGSSANGYPLSSVGVLGGLGSLSTATTSAASAISTTGGAAGGGVGADTAGGVAIGPSAKEAGTNGDR